MWICVINISSAQLVKFSDYNKLKWAEMSFFNMQDIYNSSDEQFL